MTDFVDWLAAAEQSKAHPIVVATEAHLKFVSIHPFRDGNGRLGRLLMNLLLMRAGYMIAVINHAQREQYIDALVAAQQGEKGIEPLLRLVCEAEKESLEYALETVRTAG
jgi:Fic family protein